MAVIVKCEDLEPGTRYSLYRLSSAKEKHPQPRMTFEAKQRVQAVHDTIDRGSPAIYRCRKAG